MSPGPSAADLNVQPRQRRVVYEGLARLPEGGSVRELLSDLGLPEAELREALRKLDEAGLVRRSRATWSAVPLETERPPASSAGDGPGTPADG